MPCLTIQVSLTFQNNAIEFVSMKELMEPSVQEIRAEHSILWNGPMPGPPQPLY